MAARPKPLSWGEVAPGTVTDIDPFTGVRYLRHREAVPALPETEEKGRQVLPGVEAALADLYHALWDPEPRVKEADQVPPDRRYWRELLGQALESGAYQELHAATQLKELLSVMGTVSMGETVLALIPKPDQEQLQRTAEAQARAEQAQAEADEAEAQANAAQQLAQAAAQTGAGQPSGQSQPGAHGQPQGGQPQGSGAAQGMTAEQAQALADELVQKWAEAQGRADEAQAQAEAEAAKLMGQSGTPEEAQAKLDELRRIGLAAATKARDEVQDLAQAVQAWGLEAGQLHQQGLPETLGLLERLRKNPALKKFSAILGRLRAIAARKSVSKDRGQGVRESRQETGRDIRRAVPAELVALTHPALRVKALTRWARGELRLRGEKVRRRLGHGPVVVCEDASGSMDGAKQQWTKALVLALGHFAKLQRRSFGWILFDARVHRAQVYPKGEVGPKAMLEMAEARAGGGTSFEAPLARAIEMIKQEGLNKADILLVTDGMCAVSAKFLAEIQVVKRALEVSIITVLVNVGETTDVTVRQFSDRIVKISDLSAEEAESEVFAHL